MKFFIDSAVLEDIQAANTMGLVDGVTTNPTLIKKAGQDHKTTIQRIASVIKGPISVETIGQTADEMVNEALDYVKWGDDIVIKVVMTPEGMGAVRELSKRGIQTNVTLVFSPLQAIIAAKAGATYVSPFVGRLDDIGHNGMALIEQIRTIYDNYDYPTQVLAASIRHPIHVMDAANVGADVVTVPPKILMQLFNHPLTEKGIAAFNQDVAAWSKPT